MAEEMDLELALRYITGNIDPKQKEKFDAWLAESMDHFQQLIEFKESWELCDKAFQNYEPNISKGWEILRKETLLRNHRQNKSRTLKYHLLRIACSVLILIALGIFVKLIYNFSQKEEMVTFTSNNTIISVSLSDDTKVWLNANSEIIIPRKFKGENRKMYLKGEAFFEVAKNPKKPFIIYAHQTITKVIGTSFNLNASKNDSNISLFVITGKVYLSKEKNPGSNLLLLPGQKGIINLNTGKSSKEIYSNSNFLSWKTGKLQFNKASLEELCEALSDYYRIKITIDPHINSRKFSFTGSFDNKSLLEVLNVVELTLEIKFIRTDSSFTIHLKDQ